MLINRIKIGISGSKVTSSRTLILNKYHILHCFLGKFFGIMSTNYESLIINLFFNKILHIMWKKQTVDLFYLYFCGKITISVIWMDLWLYCILYSSVPLLSVTVPQVLKQGGVLYPNFLNAIWSSDNYTWQGPSIRTVDSLDR